jgi:hypothetical protein
MGTVIESSAGKAGPMTNHGSAASTSQDPPGLRYRTDFPRTHAEGLLHHVFAGYEPGRAVAHVVKTPSCARKGRDHVLLLEAEPRGRLF